MTEADQELLEELRSQLHSVGQRVLHMENENDKLWDSIKRLNEAPCYHCGGRHGPRS